MSKIVRIVKNVKKLSKWQRWQNCQHCQKLSKNCHSCKKNAQLSCSNGWWYVPKSKGDWLTQWVSEWQGHILSCQTLVRTAKKYIKWMQYVFAFLTACVMFVWTDVLLFLKICTYLVCDSYKFCVSIVKWRLQIYTLLLRIRSSVVFKHFCFKFAAFALYLLFA